MTYAVTLLGLELSDFAIVMQFPLVLSLAAVSYSFASGFKDKTFELLTVAWLLNLAYLITRYFPEYTVFEDSWRGDLVNTGTILHYGLAIAGSYCFWAAGRELEPKRSISFVRLASKRVIKGFALISLACMFIVPLFAGEDNLKLWGAFSMVPATAFSLIALLSTAGAIKDLTQHPNTLDGKDIAVVLTGFLIYTAIQPLFILSGPYSAVTGPTMLGGLSVDAVGFGTSFISKVVIFFGSLLMLKVFASRSLSLDTLKRMKARVLHELGTPVPQMEAEIYLLMQRGGKVSLRSLKELHNIALRALALLRASQEIPPHDFFHAGELIMEDVDESELFKDESVHSINTIVEAARVAIKRTREENPVFSLSYSRNCCYSGSPILMVQVVINILRNSCDAMPNGVGTIRIHTSTHREGERDFVILNICDDGEGIPKKILERNEQYLDGYSTRGTMTMGRGYGLGITKQIVEHLGGTIEMASPGALMIDDFRKGTDVTIRLPKSSCDS